MSSFSQDVAVLSPVIDEESHTTGTMAFVICLCYNPSLSLLVARTRISINAEGAAKYSQYDWDNRDNLDGPS